MSIKTYSDHISANEREASIKEVPLIVTKDILLNADTFKDGYKDGVLDKEEVKSVFAEISRATKALLDSKPKLKSEMQKEVVELRESLAGLLKKDTDPTNLIVADSATHMKFVAPALELFLNAVQHGIDFTNAPTPSVPDKPIPSRTASRSGVKI